METLKKILTVMVVTLVLIIVAGGMYVFSRGGMDHSKMAQNNPAPPAQEGQQGKDKQVKITASDNKQDASASQQQASPNQPQSGQARQNDANQAQTGGQVPVPPGYPLILQAPPAPKPDPRIYIDQLKENVKAINDANSQIASNAGGQQMILQPGGSAVPSGTGMNELHQGFYKLGQNVSSMEQNLDNLSKNIDGSGGGISGYYAAPPAPQYSGQQAVPFYYPNAFPYNYPPYYYQYNPYSAYPQNQQPVPQGQAPVGQPGQNLTGQQGLTPAPSQSVQPGSAQNPVTNMNQGMQMNQNDAMNHSNPLGGLFNGNSLKLAFTFIFIVSLILGIVAVVGFISSLFQENRGSQQLSVENR